MRLNLKSEVFKKSNIGSHGVCKTKKTDKTDILRKGKFLSERSAPASLPAGESEARKIHSGKKSRFTAVRRKIRLCPCTYCTFRPLSLFRLFLPSF